LPFVLLSDPEKSLIGAYGVWVKKLNYGREYMGIERSTFLIDQRGKVAEMWRGVRVNGHAEAVLEAARLLS
jgi:peroxiredoxin Q/BCP